MDGLAPPRALWDTAGTRNGPRAPRRKGVLVRDGARRLGPVLWAVAALGVGAAFVAKPLTSHSPAITAAPVPAASAASGAPASGPATRPAPHASTPADASAAAVFGERLAHQPGKHWPAASD